MQCIITINELLNPKLYKFLKQVKAKKRAGVGGTYMKRLKLASDSLKNTDPESSYGTVLNMDSYLAFKG